MALLFADDTTLLLSDKNVDNLVTRVNIEFKKVVDFFRSHKLALHPDKTKFILFTNSNEVRSRDVNILLNFNNDNDVSIPDLISNLKRVSNESDVPAIKFLGIFIDPLLNFKFHINYLSSKIAKSMYFLRAVKNILTPKALKSVYYALIHSHFVYGIQIWSCVNPSSLHVLYVAQKNAIRIINQANYNAHTEPLFKISNILPLPTLSEFFKIQFIHKFLNNELPRSFESMWSTNAERVPGGNIPYLRNNNILFVPPSRLNSTEKFPLHSFPHLWVSLHEDSIKSERSKSEFNFKLKFFYIDKLASVYICTRLLCPHCHLTN